MNISATIVQDSKRSELLYYLAILFAIGAFQFPLLFMICDSFTDSGYHLSNHLLANHLGIRYIEVSPMWWFTDILGGWVMKIFGSFGVSGSKLGSLIVVALTGLITAKTLFQLYKPSLGIVFAIALASFCGPGDGLNYQIVPAFFCALFAFFFLKLHLEPESQLYPILAGLALVLGVFSRAPLILLLLIPLITFPICKSRWKDFLKPYFNMMILIGICLGSFVAFLYVKDLLHVYTQYQPPSQFHSVKHVLSMQNSLIGYLPYLGILSLSAWLFIISVQKRWLSGKLGSCLSALFFMTFLAMIGKIIPGLKGIYKIIWFDSLKLFLSIAILNFSCLFLLRNEIKMEERILYVLAMSIPFLSTFGSSTGWAGALWLAKMLTCGFTAVLLSRVAKTYNCRAALSCVGLILILTLSYRAFMHLAGYDLTFSKATTEIQAKKFHRIYTTPKRAESLGALFTEMEKYVKKGDSILVYPFNSIVYFGSDTYPLGNNACIFFLDLDLFAKKVDQIAAMAPPKLVIRAKYNLKEKALHDDDWGMTLAGLEEKMTIVDEQLLKKWGARRAWSNDQYEIFLTTR